MSDGRYKTLQMSRPWKRLAKLAANPAHSCEEIAEAFRPALLDDWQAVRPAYAAELRAAVGGEELRDLFEEGATAKIQRLRATAFNPMEALLADHGCDVAREGHVGLAAFEVAVRACLYERALQRIRQVEEHYSRHSSPHAGQLRSKLNSSFCRMDVVDFAGGVAAGVGMRGLTSKVDRSGLDVGVSL